METNKGSEISLQILQKEKIPELKERLSKKKLKVSGSKNELISRLLESEGIEVPEALTTKRAREDENEEEPSKKTKKQKEEDEDLWSHSPLDNHDYSKINDADTLRKILEQKDNFIGRQKETILKLKTELSEKTNTLKETQKLVPKSALDPSKMVGNLQKAIPKALNQQIQYKPSLGSGGSSNLNVEFPGVPEVVFYELFEDAGLDKKQKKATFTIDLLGDKFHEYFGSYIGKSLRYGANLEPTALKATYSKETQILKVNGKYTMKK